MVHACTMALATLERKSPTKRLDTIVANLRADVLAMSAWVRETDGEALGEALIQIREAGIDPLEAAFAAGLRRFDKSGEYRADGALSAVAWVRQQRNLSGGAALERVTIARSWSSCPRRRRRSPPVRSASSTCP